MIGRLRRVGCDTGRLATKPRITSNVAAVLSVSTVCAARGITSRRPRLSGIAAMISCARPAAHSRRSRRTARSGPRARRPGRCPAWPRPAACRNRAGARLWLRPSLLVYRPKSEADAAGSRGSAHWQRGDLLIPPVLAPDQCTLCGRRIRGKGVRCRPHGMPDPAPCHWWCALAVMLSGRGTSGPDLPG